MNKKLSILVIGSLNMDLILKTERIPLIGESFLGKEYKYMPGGKGANRAVAAARLGSDVTFVGKIGKDSNGIKLKNKMKLEGIKMNYLIEEKGLTTGLAVVILDNRGQNRILVYPGANMTINFKDISKAFEKDYDAVICELEIPIPIVIKTCKFAKERNIPFVLDPGPAQAFPLKKLKGLEIISPNETETLILTGINIRNLREAEKAAKIIADGTEARYVVIKMGKKGALLYTNGKVKYFPGYKVRAIDTTAAGDAFTAALTFAYLQTDIEKAINFANIIGALTVTKVGAQSSIPYLNEVEYFIKERGLKW